MYQIERADIEDVKIFKLYNEKTGQMVSVAPEHGATLAGLKLMAANTLHSVTENPTTAAEFKQNSWFKGGVLFPFPNRIADGKYTFEGQTYQLEINEPERQNAIHGFVYAMNFEVVQTNQAENQAEITLKATYKGDVPGFPFAFNLLLEYKISDKEGLTLSVKATNTGKQPMPLGFGWHPYFTVGQGPADHWQMQLPVKNKLEVNSRLLPTGIKTAYGQFEHPATIGSTQLDTGFDLSTTEGIARAYVHNPAENLTLKLWQATGPGGFNNLQVFIPPSRASVALEPMTCPAQAFNTGENLLVLQPGSSWSSACGVMLSENP